MILLDTNICIGILRGHRGVLESYIRHAGNVAISAMTEGELLYGAECSASPEKNRMLVNRLLEVLPIVHTTDAIMQTFASEKARLRRLGIPVDDADVLIAATALSLDSPLATGNVRHFSRFPNLTLDNWFEGS